MKLATLLLLLIILAVPAMAADYTQDAAMPVFSFGETGTALGTCFTVGNGQYAVTTADNVMENLGPKTKRVVRTSLVISPWSGEVYRAKIEKVDEGANLALLKFDKPGLPAASFAKTPKPVSPATLGQLINDNESAGAPWATTTYSYLAKKKDGQSMYAPTAWTGKTAFITEARGRRWLFLKDVTPTDKTPGGGPVLRDGEGVVGVYVSRFIVDGGSSSNEQRLCVPLTETIKFLESAGLKDDDLYHAAEPTIAKSEDADSVFQPAWRALSFLVQGKWDAALADAKTLTELRPKNAEAQVMYGTALAGQGKTEEALKAFNSALQLDPDNSEAMLNRAIAYGDLGKKKESEQDLRKAISLAPQDPRPAMWLSRLLAADDSKIDEAVQTAESAVKIAPDSPAAHLNLASAYAIKKDHDKSITELKKVLEVAPDYGDAMAALASEYRASGKTDEAEKEYRALVKAEPKNPAALLELAGFLIDQDKKDEAKQLISQAMDLNPNDALKKSAEELKKKTE